MFTSLATLVPLLAFAVAAPHASRQQLIPDLPAQADLAYAEDMVRLWSDKITGVNGRYNHYGDFINTVVPVATTLDQAIGKENVQALDVLADRLCIAGYQQGSTCNELFAYAYSWIVMQEKGMTWRQLAETLGANNMKQLDDDLHVICIGEETNGQQFDKELCQTLLQDTDILANSILGESALVEDEGNSNSLEYFGLADILPKPQALLP